MALHDVSEILADLIGLVTGPADIVLDSFAGSGTTGQAVLELNERDGGRRRFLLIEMEESTAREKTRVRIGKIIERAGTDSKVRGLQYGSLGDAGAVLLRDGDTIMVGNVRLGVVHTPGHTPEHLAFLVTDTAAATEPMAIVTGDFVFVGDVGRLDLLEKAAKVQGTMEASARTLFRSLQRWRTPTTCRSGPATAPAPLAARG